MRGVGLVLAALAVGPAAAQDGHLRRLDDAALADRMGGALVEGVYATGAGFTEHMMTGGATDYREEGLAPRPGRWWIARDVLCFDYGIPGTGGCFEIWQRSPNCFDLYVVVDGTAKVGLVRRMTGFGWDSRLWRTDAPSTCPVAATS